MSEPKHTAHIQTVLKDLQPPSHSETHHIIFKLATHWKSIVGKEMLKHSAPLAYRKGVLTLGVRDPTLIFQCQQSSHEWITRLNQFLQQDLIKKVEFKLI